MGNLLMAANRTIDKSNRNCSNYNNDYCFTDDEYAAEIWYDLRPSTFEIIILILYLPVVISGLVGNFLVVVAVLRTPQMRTTTNLFLLNLAIADFFVILFCLPATIVEDLLETWFFGNIACKVLKFLQNASVTVSVLTLTMISVERLQAICFPFVVLVTRKRILVQIGVIWLLGIVTSLHYIIKMYTQQYEKLPADISLFTQCKSGWKSDIDVKISLIESFLLFIIPLVWMLVAYSIISMKLWFATVPGETPNSNQSMSRTSDGGALAQRRKAALMLILVVVMFFVCYLPVHIYKVVNHVYKQYEYSVQLRSHLVHGAFFSHFLCYFNSAINPIIYNFMSTKFKQEFRHFCRCVCSSQGRSASRNANMYMQRTQLLNSKTDQKHVGTNNNSNKQGTTESNPTREESAHLLNTNGEASGSKPKEPTFNNFVISAHHI